MRTIKATKVVNAGQLYEELIAAVPELQPTPTGPDGRLEAQIVIEKAGPRALRIHVPDEVEGGVNTLVEQVVAAHKRGPEVTVDPRGDALAKLRQIAGRENPEVRMGDDGLARLVLEALGEAV